MNTLIAADSGGDGRSYHMRGKNAEHLIVNVPIGTTFRDEFGNLLADIDKHEKKFIAAHGGAGGKGNYYYLSNFNKEPREFEHTGEEKKLALELKLVADAGFVCIFFY